MRALAVRSSSSCAATRRCWATLRGVLLAGHDGDAIPPDAAAAFETLDARPASTRPTRARSSASARPTDRGTLRLERLAALRLPVLVLIVDPEVTAPSGPAQAPGRRRRRGVRRRPRSRTSAARPLSTAPDRLLQGDRGRGRAPAAGAARHGRGEADARRGDERAQGLRRERGRRSHPAAGRRAGRVRVGRRHVRDHRRSR